MAKKLTIILTLFSVALSLFNYLGLDPENIIFYSLSIPVWIIEMVSDIHYFNVLLVYLLTILSYALIGFYGDRFLQRRKAQ